MAHISKLLIQNVGPLTQSLWVLPIIEALWDVYENLEIHILVRPEAQGVFQGHPYIHRIWVLDMEEPHWKPYFKSILQTLKQEQFEFYISDWEHPKLVFLGKALKIPARIGLKRNNRNHAYTHPVFSNDKDLKTTVLQRHLNRLKVLGIPKPKKLIRLSINTDAEASAIQLIKTRRTPDTHTVFIDGSRVQVLLPGFEKTIMEWISKINSTGYYTLILYDPDRCLQSSRDQCQIVLKSDTPIADILAIIEQSDFFVGTCDGLVNYAAFLNKSILEIVNTHFMALVEGPVCHRFRLAVCKFRQTLPEQLNEIQTAWHQLNQDFMQNTEWPSSQRKRYLLGHTLRIVYIVRNIKEWSDAKESVHRCQNHGLRIHPVYIRSWWTGLFKIMWLTRRYTIHIIQYPGMSNSSFRVLNWATHWGCKWQPPKLIAQSIHDYIEPEDLLDIYEKALTERK